MRNKHIKLAFLAVVLVGSIGFSSISGLRNIREEISSKPADEISLVEDINDRDLNIKKAVGTYYDGISSSATGTTLLSALRSLNTTKRIRTIGYSNFASYYLQTDGDPNNPNNIIAYYSGTSVTFPGNFQGAVNREHVWPNSKGGGTVDGDIHMPRPTLVAENGSRGNSFYVEGMKHSSNGWDPAMESFGLEKYRGDAARIIFYCVVASSSLSLVDTNTGSGNTMGKLSHLLKWNLENPVADTEMQRNEAIAQSSVQGNRNPFIDHPEYACKIWGDYNTATRTVCDTYTTPSITLNKTTASVNIGATTTITPTVTNSTSSVTWSSNATSVAIVNSSGTVTGVSKGTATITASITENSVQYTATCVITVKDPNDIDVTGITLNKTSASIQVGETTSLTATVLPSNATINTIQWTTSNSAIATISSTTNKTITVTGVAKGSATITATTDDGGFQASCNIFVTSDSAEETVTVTRSDFSGSGTSYQTWDWAKDGISGKGRIYTDATSYIQVQATAPLPYNSTATPGPITNISVTMPGSGSLRSLTPRMSATAEITTNSGGTALSAKTFTSTTQTLSWDINSSLDYRHFYLLPGGNTNWASFSFTYENGGGSSDPVLTSISISSNPNKTSYLVGETLNLSGLIVRANYDDGSFNSNVTGYTTNPASGASLNTVGTQVVTVTYETKSTSFNVTVTAANVSLIGVSLNATSATLDIGGTLSLSPTINPTNAYPAPTISWSSSNPSVASVSSGLVTALTSGSATITVTATQSAIVKTATCIVTVNAAPFVPTTTYTEGGGVSTTATLTTNLSTLAVGDKIIIAASAESYVMSVTQNTNNRASVSATKSGDKSQITGVNESTMQIITLEAGTVANTFAFNVGNGYLYAASSGNNYLRTQSSKDANASFAITVTSAGVATAKAQGTYTRNEIKFNTSTNPKIFSCYNTGQTSIAIYEMEDGSVTKYNYNYLLDVLDGDYCTMDLTNLNLIYTRFEAMNSTEKNHFNVVIIVGNDDNNYSGLEAYTAAMIRRSILEFGSSKQTETTDLNDTSSIAIFVLAAILGISVIGTYFFFRKKYQY